MSITAPELQIVHFSIVQIPSSIYYIGKCKCQGGRKEVCLTARQHKNHVVYLAKLDTVHSVWGISTD